MQLESVLQLSQQRKKVKKAKERPKEEVEEEEEEKEESALPQPQVFNIFASNYERPAEDTAQVEEKEKDEMDDELEVRVKRAMPSIHFHDFRDYQEEQREIKREKIFDPNFDHDIEGLLDEEVFYEEKDLLPFLNKQVMQKVDKYAGPREE